MKAILSRPCHASTFNHVRKVCTFKSVKIQMSGLLWCILCHWTIVKIKEPYSLAFLWVNAKTNHVGHGTVKSGAVAQIFFPSSDRFFSISQTLNTVIFIVN